MFEKRIEILDKEFIICSETEPDVLDFRRTKCEAQVSEYELKIERASGVTPLSVKWSRHMVGLLSFWSPSVKRDRAVKQWYNANTNISNMYYGAPIISVVNQDDSNFSTVSVSDAVNPVRMTFSVNDFEEKENLDFYVYLFENGFQPENYTVKIRIDERDIPYYDTVASVSDWWKEFYPTDRVGTETGEYPLYSTWYNYHQNPTQESLEREVEDAAKYGFKSLIIDDGWSYDGSGYGDYRDCGNWNVAESKFPDFQGFVSKLHSLGIKAALWFPVPFVGYHSEDYTRFQDKMLYNSDGFMAGILDPRYPEVRKYIVDAYIEMVSRYDLDGLKLDFIDAFRCADEALLCTNKSDEYDCEQVEEGVIRLLREVREALTDKKADFMIEFRQMYVGPAIVRECNMLRVGDCPFDHVTNRVGIADLRLMNYDLAVHADMLVWAKDESLTNCAKMLLNIMFGVPQISVLFQNSNKEQKELIGRYIAYWYENRKVILHGAFKAYSPEACYSLISSEDEEKRIAVAYSRNDYKYDGKATDIFNATAYDYLYIENASERDICVVSYDCMRNQIEKIRIAQTVCKVMVPEGGSVAIR